LWLQRTARRFLPVFGLQPEFSGAIPAGGPLV
jgi:hypothetical protein